MNKINYEPRAEVYAEALSTFGTGMQLIVALEELSEAQKEICKVLRGECDLAHLAEEVADATIVLEQVRQIFGINDAVCTNMDAKILRLQKNIDKIKHQEALRRSLFGNGDE